MQAAVSGSEGQRCFCLCCTYRFLEPGWDDANSEMLLEVSHSSQSEKQQKLEDLSAWDGIKAIFHSWTDVSVMQGWFSRERAVSLAQDSPLQINASGSNLAQIVMILSRVSRKELI